MSLSGFAEQAVHAHGRIVRSTGAVADLGSGKRCRILTAACFGRLYRVRLELKATYFITSHFEPAADSPVGAQSSMAEH